MVAELIRRLANSLWLMGALFIFLIATLYFVANTGEHLDSFGRSYQWWMFGTAIALVLIGVLIIASVWRLIADLRNKVSGSRLSLKLVIMLVVMALLPMILVYSFSVKFLGSNIDSWFDVEVERALDDALALSRDSLELHMRTRQKNTVEIANALTDVPADMAVVVLNDFGGDSEASELTLIGSDNRVVATTAFIDTVTVSPERPADDIISRAQSGNRYLSLDPTNDGELQVRSVVPVYSSDPSRGVSVLFASYPVSRTSTQLADNVQESFRNYRQLAYLRAPLKRSSIATLTLAVFLSLMMAVWVAFYAARRLMVPVHDLVEGTRMVAAGDYTTRLVSSGRDELGYLVNSFNDMTDKIEAARASAASSQQQVESQRSYLELVLSRISTGVIALDENGKVRTCNDSAAKILRLDASELQTVDSQNLSSQSLFVQQFFNAVRSKLSGARPDWSREFELVDERGRKLVMCRGATMLSGTENHAGHVLVFDDISDVVEAQRNAAWSEVAKRLAHEIKNPLTPIQLSAERLQHKYAQKLHGDDAFTLKKLTNTIVHQVESMKAMVKAFAEYANTPEMDYQRINLNELITEISWLYRHRDNDFIALELDSELPLITGDPTRIRQVLHNVIKNALEAINDEDGTLTVKTRPVRQSDISYSELVFEDNGPGFPAELLDRLFEPYVTSKKKGTGLGLAIVKKIVEEHGGVVHAENQSAQSKTRGGRMSLLFPIAPASSKASYTDHNVKSINTDRKDIHGDAA